MIRSRFACATLASAGFVVLSIGLAAHLSVAKTYPADGAELSKPPDRIQVWFTQTPAPRVSRLEVKGPDGPVALGDLQADPKDRSISASVKDPLAPGRYEVTWRTAGDDGHVMRGTFGFSIRPAE